MPEKLAEALAEARRLERLDEDLVRPRLDSEGVVAPLEPVGGGEAIQTASLVGKPTILILFTPT